MCYNIQVQGIEFTTSAARHGYTKQDAIHAMLNCRYGPRPAPWPRNRLGAGIRIHTLGPVAALKVGMTIRLGDYTFTIVDMRFSYPVTGKVGVFDGDWWWGLSAAFRVPIISYPK